ncbi:MAG: PilC/PilY family type IV pilus protein [Ketobacteraceae bacterium]|nr:PilC/PilY family type IV pilus protein [Ketobacteraceae bacterium]
MFNRYHKIFSLCLLVCLSLNIRADDLDIYAGATVSGSAPAELVFAIDTSTTMSCGLDQDIFTDLSKCFVNVHPEFLNDPDIVAAAGLGGYQVPANVKLHLIQNVMNTVLTDNSILPDDVRVGLALYNDPGGSVVQPLRPLGEATGLVNYPTQRDLIRAEVNNIIPQGQTPILGTLLELGQYLTGSEVISGKRRMPRTDELTNATQNGLLTNDYGGTLWRQFAESYGETSRISHPDTVQPATLNYSASSQCVAAIDADPVLGRASPDCVFERLGSASDTVLYNEDVNRIALCGTNEELASETATTQIVLLSDGLSSAEDMSFVLRGAAMATWVNRFVRGDGNATGVLPAGYYDQSAADFPAQAAFADVGCPLSAHSSASTPDAATRKQQFDSCLFNVANRFRELGVKVNVIGFDIDDAGYQVENNNLRKIAEITGGEFRSTTDISQVESFITNLSLASVEESNLSVALSPAVSVNPGSILTNSDEVYVPVFEAGTSSLYYGNLKKYRIDVRDIDTDQDGTPDRAETVLVGANGDATEQCSIEGTNEVYTCFRPEVRDFWSSVPNGGLVTKGGSAGEQGVYGPSPDGARNLFIQDGPDPHSLPKINLIAQGPDPEFGSPDANALRVEDAGVRTATQNYYASLVDNPNQPGTKFTSFSQLQTVANGGFPEVLSNDFAYDVIRWLNGFDQNRFNSEGSFTSTGVLNERALLGDKAPVANTTDLEKSRLYYGALVHSEPTVVNYGFTRNADGSLTFDNTVFVSGNDGFLRAIDADDGSEEFSFFPEALVKNIPAWYQNTPGEIVYGLDSTWTPWRQDLPDSNGNFDGQISDGNGFVRLYGGMRRGGTSYYFLDVTNRNQPRLLKEINPQVQNFEFLGQTWSQPVLARIKKPGESVPTVVALFGGGYDPDYDPDVPDNVAASHCLDTDAGEVVCGNQIYMVEAGGFSNLLSDEANIGDIVWWASNRGAQSGFSPGAVMHSVVDNMNHSIPAKVKTLDINDDGLIDRIYVGDLGGQVFRVKINNNVADASDPNGEFIQIDTLAQVGHEGFETQSAANNRMFYESPSVAVMKHNNQQYIGIALGSGWRANPGDKTIEEELYFFRDELAGNATIIKRPTGGVSTADFILGLESFNGTQSELDNARGLALSLNSDGNDAGEKAFGSPLILFGNVVLPIYVPPSEVESQASLNNCQPPPHRSSVVGFRAQSSSQAFFLNNDGVIEFGQPPAGAIAVTFRTPAAIGVPFSGMSGYQDSGSFTLLAGTESITVPLDQESVKRTQWSHEDSGEGALGDITPVSGDPE